jgi:DME family drug/metabolite transporter
MLVLAASLFWGTTGTAQALAPEGAHPVLVGTVRISVATLVLLGAALSRRLLDKGKRNGNSHDRSSRPVLAGLFEASPSFSNPWLILAGFGLAGYQPLFFSSVSLTGVAVGTVVTLGSGPVLSGLLDWILGRGRPGWLWSVATTLAIVGCAILAFGKHELVISPLGILLAAGAGCSFSLYAAATKHLLAHHDSSAILLPAFILGSLMLFPVWFIFPKAWLFTPRGLAVALHLGLVATALAYALFTRGLQGIRAPTAVTLTMAEPLTATLLGVFYLGESLSASALIGILVVFSGLAIVSLGSIRVRAQASGTIRNASED